MKVLNLLLITFLCTTVNATGSDHDHDFNRFRDREPSTQTSSGETVTWIGSIGDDWDSHNEHQHDLKFTRQNDGKSFDLESKPLMTLHHERERNLLVEITAVRTPKFLFWGNNLIVKEFKVLKELETVPHQPIEQRRRIESPHFSRI